LKKRHFWKIGATSALALTLLFSTTLPLPGSFGVTVAHAAGTTAAPAVDINSPSALLIDVKSGQVLYSKDEHARRYPASVTKIMTMLLAYDAIAKGEKKLTDIVPVTPDAYNVEGSSAWIDPKEKWTLDEMLKFIAIPSANDACVATADFIAGSEGAFVDRMNKRAKELGMNDTHFADSNGLHDPNHYTSAHDIAIMARELITKYPQVLQISSVPYLTIRNGANKLENTNHVLGHYDGMDGLKTGFTDQAGYNLVGTAQRNGFRILSVELGAPDDNSRVDNTVKLLDYGFNNFKETTVIKKGEAITDRAPIESGKDKDAEVVAATDLSIALPNNNAKYDKTVSFNNVQAPVKQGDKLGKMNIVQGGKVVASVDLVAKDDVEKGSWLRLMFRGIGNFFGGMFSAIGHGIGGLFK
jgi:serine-type D-Ala-D-Ala carboxypeptidase (penicillin-binding protein 5/6)